MPKKNNSFSPIIKKAKNLSFYQMPIDQRSKAISSFFDEMEKGVGNVNAGRKIMRNLRGAILE